jgi:hypothetical protein
MIPVIATLLLAAAPVSPDVRIAASAAAAQALQGPLDGTWAAQFWSHRNIRTGYTFQIVDTVTRRRALQAAWCSSDGKRCGYVEKIRHSSTALHMKFHDQGIAVDVDLQPSGPRTWRGEIERGDEKFSALVMAPQR